MCLFKNKQTKGEIKKSTFFVMDGENMEDIYFCYFLVLKKHTVAF